MESHIRTYAILVGFLLETVPGYIRSTFIANLIAVLDPRRRTAVSVPSHIVQGSAR